MGKSPINNANNLRSPPSNNSPFFQEKLLNRRLTKEFNDLNFNLDAENLKFQGQSNYLISPILKPRPDGVTPTLAKIENYEVLINFSIFLINFQFFNEIFKKNIKLIFFQREKINILKKPQCLT